MKQSVVSIISNFVQTINVLIIPISAGIAKHLLVEKSTSFGGFFSDIFIAGFGGYMAHLLLLDMDIFTIGQKSVIIGITALSADMLLNAILKLARRFSDNPQQFIEDARNLRLNGIGLIDNNKKSKRKSKRKSKQ